MSVSVSGKAKRRRKQAQIAMADDSRSSCPLDPHDLERLAFKQSASFAQTNAVRHFVPWPGRTLRRDRLSRFFFAGARYAQIAKRNCLRWFV